LSLLNRKRTVVEKQKSEDLNVHTEDCDLKNLKDP